MKKYASKLEIKKYENKLEIRTWNQIKDGVQGLLCVEQKLILRHLLSLF